MWEGVWFIKIFSIKQVNMIFFFFSILFIKQQLLAKNCTLTLYSVTLILPAQLSSTIESVIVRDKIVGSIIITVYLQ